jgi:hypothetical protein
MPLLAWLYCTGEYALVRNPGQAMAEITLTGLMWTAARTEAFWL